MNASRWSWPALALLACGGGAQREDISTSANSQARPDASPAAAVNAPAPTTTAASATAGASASSTTAADVSTANQNDQATQSVQPSPANPSVNTNTGPATSSVANTESATPSAVDAETSTSGAEEMASETAPTPVDWTSPTATADFEQGNRLVGFGLWMGSNIGETLPLDTPPPSGEQEASTSSALHLTGVAGSEGTDTYWHTAFPFEQFAAVRFQARTNRAEGQTLLVTPGGPSEWYWADLAAGKQWPAKAFELDTTWREFELVFTDLGWDAEHLAPYSDPFGALHFLTEPDAEYDVWLDDLTVFARVQ